MLCPIKIYFEITLRSVKVVKLLVDVHTDTAYDEHKTFAHNNLIKIATKVYYTKSIHSTEKERCLRTPKKVDIAQMKNIEEIVRRWKVAIFRKMRTGLRKYSCHYGMDPFLVENHNFV